ncbi:hypothetical protein EZV62_003586 [Acer yangbiense]|uniref:ABC transmembrane type-1 domain-containing protein n=1 Tax=Acer yangbiense TaxID=1000413 RepID=A0A5C7IHQ0_9ROSI|nr:hypothetical protein EZV62_003586 [Acer yangbiense]
MPKVAKLKLFLSPPSMVPDLDTGYLRSELRYLLKIVVGVVIAHSPAAATGQTMPTIEREFSWICGGGELDLGSINKHHIIESHGRNWFSVVVSICCALVSIAYFVYGLWILIAKSDGFDTLRWTIAVIVLPLLLYAFVNYSNRDEENLREGLAIVGCLIITKVVESLSQRHSYFDSRRSGMRMKSALMVAAYKKQLMLSSLGRTRHSAGEIVNYIAVDAYRMGEFPWWFHSTWSLTLQLFLAIAVLFGVVGLGALPGLIPLLQSP